MEAKMKKFLFIILILLLAIPLSGQPVEIGNKEIQKSSNEIRLLNLLNSLYLTPEQTQFIINRVKRLEDIRRGYPEIEEDYQETLEGIKEDLKKDNFVTDEKREEFERLKKTIEEEKKEYQGLLKQYAVEIKNNLTPIQQQIIEDYNPCIIPPKGPSRIGQAGEARGVEKHLDRIYNIPEEEYKYNKYNLAEKALKHLKEETDDRDLSNKILEFHDRIRDLDEIEFIANKEKLAKEFKELFPVHKKSPDLITKIQKFLLNPNIVPLLEERDDYVSKT